MTDERRFVDTNVLVYAHDATAGDKRTVAQGLVEELWESGEGCLSVQVLQELFVTVTRRVPRPLDVQSAENIVADFARWRTHSPRAADVIESIEIHRHSGISFWDAMIIHSARRLGCQVLYSEDFSPGQTFGGLRVVNPFSG